MVPVTPGFRFHPTDVELVCYYLKRKIIGKKFPAEVISEIDIYKFCPWDLAEQSCLRSKDLEWYFFCPRDKKYHRGSRINRATKIGYWKPTGKDRFIIHGCRPVGTKKTLIFYTGRAPHGARTDWVMYEYRLDDEELVKAGFSMDTYVLCKIFHKNGVGQKGGAQYGAPFVEEDWEDESIEKGTTSGLSADCHQMKDGDATILQEPVTQQPSCSGTNPISLGSLVEVPDAELLNEDLGEGFYLPEAHDGLIEDSDILEHLNDLEGLCDNPGAGPDDIDETYRDLEDICSHLELEENNGVHIFDDIPQLQLEDPGFNFGRQSFPPCLGNLNPPTCLMDGLANMPTLSDSDYLSGNYDPYEAQLKLISEMNDSKNNWLCMEDLFPLFGTPFAMEEINSTVHARGEQCDGAQLQDHINGGGMAAFGHLVDPSPPGYSSTRPRG